MIAALLAHLKHLLRVAVVSAWVVVCAGLAVARNENWLALVCGASVGLLLGLACVFGDQWEHIESDSRER